jgi:hypothetical protein
VSGHEYGSRVHWTTWSKNKCYGGRIKSVAKIKSMIEKYSHFTQITQLQSEYMWTRQVRFRLTRYGSRCCLDDIGE